MSHGVLLLQREVEVAGARLDLVLGLQVVHAVSSDAIDGQHQVTHGDLRLLRLPSVSQLKGTQKRHVVQLSSNTPHKPSQFRH